MPTSSGQKGREILLNQSSTQYNSRGQYPSLYRHGVQEEKKTHNSEFGSETNSKTYTDLPRGKTCRRTVWSVDSLSQPQLSGKAVGSPRGLSTAKDHFCSLETTVDSSSSPIIDNPFHLQTCIKISALLFPPYFIKLCIIFSDELKNSTNKLLYLSPQFFTSVKVSQI